RALCEPVRLLLHFVGEDFIDKRYQVGPPPAYDKSEWNSEKKTLGLAIPNLPYYKDSSGVVLTQVNAILYYIADKNGLCGSTPAERATVVMMVEGLRDWMNTFFDVTYCNAPWVRDQDDVHRDGEDQAINMIGSSPKFDSVKKAYLENELPKFLKLYSDILGAHGPWLLGESMTHADFVLYEYLDQHRIFSESCLASYSPLLIFMCAFEALPKIQEYRSSKNFRAEPLHNRYSQFHRGWVV
ncbi:unnamed protein product, partial [Ectocarpus fasciculatus]